MSNAESNKDVKDLQKELQETKAQLSRTQEELNQSKERYHRLFDNLGDEVHLWELVRDQNGEIQTWKLADVNPSGLTAWGKTKDEVIGKTTNEIFGFDATSQFLPMIKELFDRGEVSRWVEYFKPTNQFLSMSSVPMGEYFISTGRDISDEKKAQQEIAENAEKFTAVFKNSAVAKILADKDGNYVDVNDKACELLGYSAEELTSMSVVDIVKMSVKATEDLYDEFTESGMDSGEVELICKNGDIKIAEYFAKQINDNLFLSTLVDRTEKRKIEKKIKIAEERLRTITNSIPGMIYQFQINKDGTYHVPFISDRAEELLGYTNEKMRDVEFLFSRIHPEDYLRVTNSIIEANRDEALWSQEFRAYNKNDKVVWISGQSYGTKDDNGNVVHNGVLFNINEKKSAEKALKVSREKYRHISENVPGIVMSFQVSPDGTDKLLYISKGVESLYEVSPKEALDNNELLYKRIHKGDRRKYSSSLRQSKEQLTPWELEYRLKMPDGRLKWVFIKGIPSEQKNGNIVWDCVGIDITQQKQAEKALEIVNDNLEKLVEQRTEKISKVSKELELYWLAAEYSQAGVWHLDLQNNILEWDSIMYKLYGINPKDFSGAYDAWEKSLHPDDRERAVNEFNKSIELKQDLDTLYRVVHPDSGKTSHIRSKGRIEIDETGTPVAIFGTNWDVTREMNLSDEKEQALKDLKEAQSQLILAEKMASLGILTAGVAHEINNPLNYIQGGQIAIEDSLNESDEVNKEELTEYLGWIKTGVERATNVVKSLNLFSRSNQEQDEICDLNLISENCLMVLTQKHKDRIQIKRDFSKEECAVIGNNGRLHQAILNILSNAIDSIEKEGKISIKTKVKGDKAICIIKDNGSGISKDNLERIMDPFFTTKPPGKGTGLGLAITKSIIDDHDGKLLIKSELDKGTTCEIKLPKSRN